MSQPIDPPIGDIYRGNIPVPGIYKKLHAIMAEAQYIHKDGKNTAGTGGYTYATEAAIKNKLHGLFVKHGVVFSASAMNQQIREMGQSARGNTMWLTTLDFVYRFTDIEDGSHVEGTMIGCGTDTQDKGAYKAITGALKYALTSTFIIPTGDDPENEDGSRKEKKQEATHKGRESTTIGAAPPPDDVPTVPSDAPYISEPRRKRLFAIKQNAKWTDDQMKNLLIDFGYASSKTILNKDYDRICGIVEHGDYDTYLDDKTNRAV